MKIAFALAWVAIVIVFAITGRLSERSFVFRVLLYLDIFLCALVLGDTDMTISARCGLALRDGYPWPLVYFGKALNSVSKNHCENAINHDLARARTAIGQLLGEDEEWR